jgi:hypothetical protein
MRSTLVILGLVTAAAVAAARGADVQPLPFYYDLYAFRGAGDSTAVIATFAVPAGHLEREPHGGAVRYRFDVTLVLADTVQRTVSRTDDSVYVAVSRALAGEHLLYTHIAVQATPSGSTLQRVIVTDATRPGIGQLYSSSFPIPDFNGSTLMLSDVAVARSQAASVRGRSGDRPPLLPASSLPGSAFDLYYEIYNLPTGTPYVTEIALEPVDRDGIAMEGPDEVVRVRYREEAAHATRGTVREQRHVEASVPRGRYRLTVTVTDEATGASASSSRLLEVRGWRRGATPVAALPRGAGPRSVR